ncbi:MAG: endo-1,4-beta-xylanase [Lentisphaeraceae bacterium]|nr:endo-1,4-beta-xylanase [Lentisphaeraceae bacterium]
MKTIVVLVMVCLAVSLSSQNLVRNGSFESGIKYWLDADQSRVKEDGSPHGFRYYDYGEKNHYLRSTPMMIDPNTDLVVTCMARVSENGKKNFLHLDLLPTTRTSGNGRYRAHYGDHGWKCPVKLTDKWQKVVWKINTPGPNFKWRNQMWDKRSWIIMLQAQNVQIDAFTISKGKAVPKDYVSYNPVSVGMNCLNMPGFKNLANILPRDFNADCQADVFNNTEKDLTLTVKWQQFSYDNKKVYYEKSEQLKLGAGKRASLSHKMNLKGEGLVLARCQVESNGKVLGKSDQPLTTLPFPKNATKPNMEEAFGASFFGGIDVDAGHVIGLGWSRWYPHTKWDSIQPEGPDKFNFPDKVVDLLENKGISMNFVLYSLPKWVKGKHHNLPKDMQDWGRDDKRWQDLSIETYWDKYVKTMVNRYKTRAIAWEIVNEPVFENWDPRIYKNFIERTYRQIKKIDPKLTVMIDACYGINDFNYKFLKEGGTDCWDVYTWHNYSVFPFSTYGHIQSMFNGFKELGRKKPAEIWFNEGWAHTPSSIDDGVHSVIGTRSPAIVAHDTVRAMADTFAAGMKKMIVFQITNNQSGRSWWQWGTDGTQWWDDRNNPTIMVGVFNVLADQLGLSEPVDRIPLKDGIATIFKDKRNNRGLAIIWSNKEAAVYNPGLAGLTKMDVMGNVEKLSGSEIATEDPAKPWYIFGDYTAEQLQEAFLKLKSSEISLAGGIFKLPKDWMSKGAKSNPYVVEGKDIWRFDRIYPPETENIENYHLMTDYDPVQAKWFATKGGHGGNPAASVQDGVRITAITQWKGGEPVKPSALIFKAPKKGTYTLNTTVNGRRWTGGAKQSLELVKLNRKLKKAKKLQTYSMKNGQDVSVRQEVELDEGEELAIVFRVDHGMHTGAGMVFKELQITQASEKVDFSEKKIRELNK